VVDVVKDPAYWPLLAAEPDQPVYAGDEPSLSALLLRDVQRTLDEMIERAHREPEIAEQLMSLFAIACRTAAEYERERDYVIGLGVPAEFLPTAANRPGLAA
jgi:hypothetical protein